MNKITHPKINNPKLIRSRESKVVDSKNTFLKRSQIKTKKVKRVSFLRLLILILVAAAIIFGAYLILKTSYLFVADLSKSAVTKVDQIKEDRNLKQFEKTESVQIDTKILTQEDVMKSLASIINLPKEDMSIFAKVKDPATLEKESSFYQGIKRGDYIVVYPSLAVIYDAEQEKIIRSMPLK
jgi:beta-lactamase regulating signal transducer with metallopeptidase domain